MDSARLRPHHSRTHSQKPGNPSDYQSSDDGYDYNIVNDAPEAQPTKPQEIEPAKLRRTPTEVIPLGRLAIADNASARIMPHIFQRPAGGRRAKIPTDTDVDLEQGTNGGDTLVDENEPRKAAPELTNIKLQWTMLEINGRRVLQLKSDKADVEVQQPYLQRRRVRWQ